MSDKRQYPNLAQKSRLVELLEADAELRQGKFTSSFTKKIAEARWMKIAEELNGLGGCNKSWSDWRKSWQDMKSKIKKKHAAIRRNQNITGGGPPGAPLTDQEEQVLSTMSAAAVAGHADSQESAVCFKDVLGPCRIDKILPPTAPAAASIESLPVVDNDVTKSVPAIKFENLEVPKCSTGIKNKTKKTMAQKRLQKSMETAGALVEVLKEKNKIRKDYYASKIYEMRRQSEALLKIADSLSSEN